MSVLIVQALLFGARTRAPEFWKLPCSIHIERLLLLVGKEKTASIAAKMPPGD